MARRGETVQECGARGTFTSRFLQGRVVRFKPRRIVGGEPATRAGSVFGIRGVVTQAWRRPLRYVGFFRSRTASAESARTILAPSSLIVLDQSEKPITITQRDRRLAFDAAAHESEHRVLTRGRKADQPHQVVGVSDGDAVDFHDDIA